MAENPTADGATLGGGDEYHPGESFEYDLYQRTLPQPGGMLGVRNGNVYDWRECMYTRLPFLQCGDGTPCSLGSGGTGARGTVGEGVEVKACGHHFSGQG